ncbi:MAG: hypothetical protein WDM79_18945 [Terricaulis sp.]
MLLSPDGRDLARVYYPGIVRTARLGPEMIWSERASGLALDAGSPVQGRDDGSLWVALQERMDPSQWRLAPVRIATIKDGAPHELSSPQHPAGPLDTVQWIGDGLFLAEFGARGDYYRPRRQGHRAPRSPSSMRAAHAFSTASPMHNSKKSAAAPTRWASPLSPQTRRCSRMAACASSCRVSAAG